MLYMLVTNGKNTWYFKNDLPSGIQEKRVVVLLLFRFPQIILIYKILGQTYLQMLELLTLVATLRAIQL